MHFLNTPLSEILTLKPAVRAGLSGLGIKTVRDILYYFPKKYSENTDSVQIQSISSNQEGNNGRGNSQHEIIVFGKISKLKASKTFKGKVPMATAILEDDTGSVKLLWIRQPYIAKLINDESLIKITGKPSFKDNSVTFINPRVEPVAVIPQHVGGTLFSEAQTTEEQNITCSPTYAETKGVSSLWLYHATKKIMHDPRFALIEDPIDPEIRKKYNLPGIQTAFIWIHTPQKEADAEVARKRFAFEEIFFIQLSSQIERQKSMREKSYVIADNSSAENFIKRLPFPLTESQQKAIDEVLEDMKRPYPMSRLLEGDVGSGKTAVAAAASYAVVKERPKNQKFGTLQVAYMAPTEILAKQHFESFISLFKHLPISIGLITGKECRKFPSKLNPGGWTNISKSQLGKWVENGEIAIVIGTHALIQKNVKFKHLGLVVIDEQHRFGTNQRQKLARKQDITPHLLSMTATPIPRTLALTLYGDLDLSLLDQMPSGRKKIETKITKPAEIKKVYEHIREEIEAGRQAYIICPRIEESDEETAVKLLQNPFAELAGKIGGNSATLRTANPRNQATAAIKNMKSVVNEAVRLKKEIFTEFTIGILHGKMKPLEKEKTMNAFLDKKIDILVATSVVEVGVNVPNASIILIEHAERYGLSQLHQLRGRVIRGNHQPFCYLSSDTTSKKSNERLQAIKSAKNGFELAELDLKIRGIGELYGGKQWGMTDIAMDAIKNLKMVEIARKEATAIATTDPDLKGYPLLKEKLATREEIHFE